MRKLITHSTLQVFIFLCFHSVYAQINEQSIKKHIYYLASEELNGRIAGTEEGKKAADYIANEFVSAGLSAFTDSTHYYQDFSRSRTIAKPSFLSNGIDTFLVAHINKKSHWVEDALIELVESDDQNRKEESSVFVKLYADTFEEGMQKVQDEYQQTGKKEYVLLMSNKKKKRFKINLKSLKAAKSAQEVFVLTNYLHYAHDKAECDAYLKGFEHLNVLVASEKSISELIAANAEPIKRLRLNEEPDSLISKKYRNVIAKIEGSQKEQPTVVFCAHYDHVDSLYSRKIKGDQLTDYYPGADDNASGTAAVIEIAKSLKKANYQPEHTIYFCLFDAEEQGLYGSRHFAKAIKQDVALVINMDMIGRNKRDRKSCEDVIFAKAQGKHGREFVKGFDKYAQQNSDFLKVRRFDTELLLLLMGFPSDQASFRPHSDTSVFYTGLHKDYHTPNDIPEKINYRKLTEYINIMSSYMMQNKL